MAEFRVRFSGRAHSYTDDEVATVVDAMRSADPLTQGPYLAAFESRFRDYAGVSSAYAVHSATAALERAAQLCCFKPGDEVIIPSHTFTSTAYPFVKFGARIAWVDIERDTRVVSARTIEKGITPRTKAVVVPHLYGFAADMPDIIALAKRHGLLVVEDAAQSLGSEVGGRKSGTFGDFGVFSFHSHKNVTTLGEGGMLVVADQRRAELVPMLRHNGHCDFPVPRPDYWVPAMSNVDLPSLDGVPLMPGNCCMGEVEAALGAKLLDRIEQINRQKRARAMVAIDAMQDFPELVFHRENSSRHNYHLLAARLDGGRRDDFIRRMNRDHGIQCVVQYCPLNRYPFYEKLGFGRADCPNADEFFDSMVSFPFQHSLPDEDLDYMLDAARQVLKQLRS